eukprot:7349774-Pyramimonas_sp.AAC.2
MGNHKGAVTGRVTSTKRMPSDQRGPQRGRKGKARLCDGSVRVASRGARVRSGLRGSQGACKEGGHILNRRVGVTELSRGRAL